MNSKLAVCYFGSYGADYSRNKILIDGLEKNNVMVYHCHDSSGSFLTRYPKLRGAYWPLRKNVDVIVVGFRGHLDMPLAWVLAKVTGKKVIFDAFISIYDTYLNDRRLFGKHSIKAYFYWAIDYLACMLADHVVLDTKAQIDYFTRTFHLPRHKFSRIFVGGDDTLFTPRPKPRRSYVLVEWHGIFTRLHGIERVLNAAKLLEKNRKIKFLFIGDNPYFEISEEAWELLTTKRPGNLIWYKTLPIGELVKKVAGADITIGHFGTTEKALNVLTNKIFHGLAVGNAIIVEDSPASRELLTDGKNCLFAKPGDVKGLAEKITRLAADEELRRRIATAGYKLYTQKLTNSYLGKGLLNIITMIN